MPVRKSSATWTGNLREGRGEVKLGSGAFTGKYSFGTRFEEQPGTNPEELIAAAHAACYSMALAAGLGGAGYQPQSVQTEALVQIDKVDAGFKITRITLRCVAQVPGIDAKTFQEFAEKTKAGCPVSQALAATPMVLEATLKA